MEMPIRVLQVVHSMNMGGIEMNLMNLYRSIDRNKVQFDFLYNTDAECHFDKEILQMGGRIYRIHTPYRPVFTLTYKKEIDSFFKRHRYHVVHAHRNTVSIYALEAAMKNGVKTRIAHSHAATISRMPRRLFEKWNKLFINKYSTHRFACSDEAGKWLYGNLWKTDESYQVINNGIDVNRFSVDLSQRSKMRSELGIDNNALLLGHVGRFANGKNQEFLLDVFTKIYHKNPDAKLLLIGTGSLLNSVKEKSVELGINSNVIFAGVKSNVEDYYQAMDVFLLPSNYEGLGIVAIEAQAAGLPCVVSTGVPQSVCLSENVQRISLNAGAEKWAEMTVQMQSLERNNGTEIIRRNKYDIRDIVKRLEEFYYSTL